MHAARRNERRFAPWALGLVLVVIAVDLTFAYYCDSRTGGVYPPLDDAYIHAQLARNFATGHGWSFNPDSPTAASTSPLFTLLLAGAGAACSTVAGWLWAGRWLGLVFHAGCAVLVYSFLRSRWTDRTALAGTLAALLTGNQLWAALSGMEIMLTAFLCLALVLLQIQTPDTRRTALLQGQLGGLLLLTRPDTAPLLLVLLADRLVVGRTASDPGPRTLRLAVRSSPLLWMLPVCCAGWLALYAGFAAWAGVSPLPNSFAAKAGFDGLGTTLNYWGSSLFMLFRFHPVLFGAMLLATPAGLWQWLHGRCSLALVGGPWMVLLSQSLFNPHWYNHGRYIMFLVPLMLLLVAEVTARQSVVWPRLAWQLQVGRQTWQAGISRGHVAHGLLVLALLFSAYSTTTWARHYQQDQAFNLKAYGEVTDFLHEHHPAITRLVAHDIGYFGFVGGFRVYDLAGLATPEVLAWRRLPRDEERARLARDIQRRGVQAGASFWYGYRGMSLAELLPPATQKRVFTHLALWYPAAPEATP